eukprot:g46853.t1
MLMRERGGVHFGEGVESGGTSRGAQVVWLRSVLFEKASGGGRVGGEEAGQFPQRPAGGAVGCRLKLGTEGEEALRPSGSSRCCRESAGSGLEVMVCDLEGNLQIVVFSGDRSAGVELPPHFTVHYTTNFGVISKFTNCTSSFIRADMKK